MLPSANADAPTSLSSVLLLGLHRIGESTDVALHRVRGFARPEGLSHPSRQTYGLEQKGDGPVPPVSQSRLRAAASPALSTRRCP